MGGKSRKTGSVSRRLVESLMRQQMGKQKGGGDSCGNKKKSPRDKSSGGLLDVEKEE